MPRIKIIDYDESDGRLREIYDELSSSRGKLAEVHKLQSLLPETIVKHIELYKEIMFAKDNLSRELKELIAVVVSIHNKCKYCILHHSEALNHYWKSQEKIDLLIQDYTKLNLPEKTTLILNYAKKMTLTPHEITDIDVIQLRNAGYDDKSILSVNLVVSYFNFVNRLVLAVDLEINNNEISGYIY